MTAPDSLPIRSSAVSHSTYPLDVSAYAARPESSVSTVAYTETSAVYTAAAVTALDQHHQLSEPLLVEVTRDEEGTFVSDRLIARFGEGSSFAEALSDYASNVLDYFAFLRRRRDRLSPRLARHLRLLEDRIIEA